MDAPAGISLGRCATSLPRHLCKQSSIATLSWPPWTLAGSLTTRQNCPANDVRLLSNHSLTSTMLANAPQASHTTTILFFALILIAFFPGIFHYLWTLPLSLIFSSSTTPTYNGGGPAADIRMGSWYQKQFTLPSKSRGSYLITDHVVSSLPELKQYKVGLLNLFVQHTSCALSLNENWDDDVRADMSDALDRIAPEEGPKGEELYRHSAG